MDIPIVVPSHKRAERVKTIEHVNRCILCVAESQVKEYELHNPGVEILAHPDDLIGLVRKRQWIYEQLGNCFQIDDDSNGMHAVWDTESYTLDPETAYDVIQATANTARKIGAYLFGFGQTPDPVFCAPQRPFSMTCLIGGAIGVLAGGKLKFDAGIPLGMVCNEDWVALGTNAYYHRYHFCDQRYAFSFGSTFCNKGGISEFRTIGSERKDGDVLRALFGDAVRQKKTSKRTRDFQIQIKIPW